MAEGGIFYDQSTRRLGCLTGGLPVYYNELVGGWVLGDTRSGMTLVKGRPDMLNGVTFPPAPEYTVPLPPCLNKKQLINLHKGEYSYDCAPPNRGGGCLVCNAALAPRRGLTADYRDFKDPQFCPRCGAPVVKQSGRCATMLVTQPAGYAARNGYH